MDFIDELHRECAAAQFDIRRDFARVRAGVQIWEPAPIPRRFAPVPQPTYLDEVERPQKPWFR